MNWEKTRLGDVLEYEQPTKYIVESTQYNEVYETPVLTAGQSFILGYTNETENIFTDVPVIIFDDFTTAIKYVDFPFKVKSSAMKILKADNKISDIRFLFHLMSTLKIDSERHKRYWISKYAELKIPLPPLETQKKIAAILDEADKLRQLNKQLIKKYDALTQSLFIEMFGDPGLNPKGYEKTTIRKLVTEAKYGTSSKASKKGKYTYLRMNNITYSGYMDYSNLKYIDVSESEKLKYNVQYGDVIFNRTNSKELVGKTGIITSTDEMIIAGYLIRLRTTDDANPFYIWAHLNSKWAKKTLLNMCKSIVGMANINAQELQNIQILKTPIQLQNQFAERVQDIEQQKEQAQEALQKSEDLFNSLLQKAFKGELVK